MIDHLSPDLQRFVEQQIADGAFTSERDVLQAGLRLLQRRVELQKKIRMGREQIELGQGIEVDESELEQFFADIAAEVQQELTGAAKKGA